MEEFLSHKGIPFELRDLVQDPLTSDELWQLLHDAEGRQIGPLTKLAKGVVMGWDPARLSEYLDQYPEIKSDGATVYGWPGETSTEAVLTYLRERAIPATTVDVRKQPMSRAELWAFLEIPGSNIRTPLVDVNGTVVLGNDRERIEELLGS